MHAPSLWDVVFSQRARRQPVTYDWLPSFCSQILASYCAAGSHWLLSSSHVCPSPSALAYYFCPSSSNFFRHCFPRVLAHPSCSSRPPTLHCPSACPQLFPPTLHCHQLVPSSVRLLAPGPPSRCCPYACSQPTLPHSVFISLSSAAPCHSPLFSYPSTSHPLLSMYS